MVYAGSEGGIGISNKKLKFVPLAMFWVTLPLHPQHCKWHRTFAAARSRRLAWRYAPVLPTTSRHSV